MKKIILITAMTLFSFNSLADDSKNGSANCAYRSGVSKNAKTVAKKKAPVSTETQETRQIVR